MTTSETGPRAAAVPRDVLAAVAAGAHHDPHGVLGAHVGEDGMTVRTLKPFARSVTVVTEDGRTEAHHEHDGIWAAGLPGTEARDYRLEIVYDTNEGQAVHLVDDPYRYLPTLGEVDLHLIREGRHEQLWTVLGAHVRRYDGPWAPAPGRASRCGRPTPGRSGSSATSTPGTGAPTRCGPSAVRASGRSSSPGWSAAPATSTSCSARTAAGTRRRTRWRAPRRSRRRPPRSSPSPPTPGATTRGWPSAPSQTCTTRR
jgi:1,4-alpha-glucan branching enzyme